MKKAFLRRSVARQFMLAEISAHVLKSNRLMLGISLNFGDYDFENKRFPAQYPTTCENDYLRRMNIGRPLMASTAPWAPGQRYGLTDSFSESDGTCTPVPFINLRSRNYTYFHGGGHLSVNPVCDQNTELPISGFRLTNAIFTVRPVALYIWLSPRQRPFVKSPDRFLYAYGHVKGPNRAPPNNFITPDLLTPMDGKEPSAAAQSGLPAFGECPDGLPADATTDQCGGQKTLASQRIYMKRDGHIGRLAEVGGTQTREPPVAIGGDDQRSMSVPDPTPPIQTR